MRMRNPRHNSESVKAVMLCGFSTIVCDGYRFVGFEPGVKK